jgi:outer membrane protein assembly factor BamB
MHWYQPVVVAGACVAAACSSNGGGGATKLTEAWSVTSITPIGQPVAAGGMVIVYGTQGRDLNLYGVSVADGAVRWTQAATPSATTSGIALTPEVIDGRVVYFRPDAGKNLGARLVAASPETGDDLLVSEPAVFASHPGHCSDHTDICVRLVDGNGTSSSRRYSVEAKGLVADKGAPPPGSRELGEDLLDLGQRQPEVLAGFHGGTVLWRSPLSDHVAAGSSTDLGWYFELYRAAGLHVGSVGRPVDRSDASVVVIDLSKAQTVALDAATGAPVWRSDGTSFACRSSIVLARSVGDDRSEQWPVRCRYHGIERYDRATDTLAFDNLDVIMEGFDVGTGNAIWSVPLGRAEAFVKGDSEQTVVGDDEVLIGAETGPVVVNLATGATRAPGKGQAFWCASKVKFQYRESAFLRNGGTLDNWRGGILLQTCAADGSPTTRLPERMAKDRGATVHDRTVVATARGLVAYDRRAA